LDFSAAALPEILIIIGVITYVASYLFRNDNHLKTGFIVSNIVWIGHFWITGIHIAAFSTLLLAARTLFTINAHQLPSIAKHILFGVFTCLLATATILTWNGLPSILAGSAYIGITYALFYFHGVQLRKSLFVVDLIWLTLSLITGSPMMLIYAVGSLALNAFTISQMDSDKELAETFGETTFAASSPWDLPQPTNKKSTTTRKTKKINND
jgi:hypothetical protein